MAFQYTPIGHFKISTVIKADKLRQKDGEGKKSERTINKAYLVKNHGLSFAHLVVHLVPGSKTDWTVSERFTGLQISEKPAKSKDTAVRQAVARIREVGRSKYEQAIANFE